jgi:hypothetical protein
VPRHPRAGQSGQAVASGVWTLLFRTSSRPVVRARLNRKDPIQALYSEYLCAGINRHGVEDERALRVRTSDPLGLESCASPIVR